MTWLKKAHEFCNRYEWLILIVGLIILMRIPTLFTPHYYGDEEIYFVMGRAWRTGIPMYQAMFDHKPPLLYVLAGIADSVFWFRMMLLIVMVVHTIVFYLLAQKLFAKINAKMPLVSTIIFAILTTIPSFEGNIANAELFMMLPLTLGLYLVLPSFAKETPTSKLTYQEYSWKRYLMAGMIAGIGWLFKVPVAADFAAIALFIFPISQSRFRDSIRSLFSWSFIAFVGGFVLPLLSSFAYYYLKGHGPAYLATVLTVNLGYVSSWSTSQFAFNPFKSGLLTRGVITASIALFIYLFRHKIDKRLQLVMLWLTFSFFGALLSGRPYPHYLQEPFVPLALVVPFLFMTETVVGWILIALFSLWAVYINSTIHFWVYNTWSIYSNFAKTITGKMSRQDYIYSFDGARRNYIIGDYLKSRMRPDDKLFVWGSDTTLYNITETLPSGGKYMVDFHVHDFHAEDYVIDNLEKNKPRFIVVLPNAQAFPTLETLLNKKYVEVFAQDGAIVYMELAKYGDK